MSEPHAAPPGGVPNETPAGATAADDGSAGALLRAARSRQGMHIAMLAASIKVPQAKLEALEAGRYDELPDATFTRALAQSLCRVLKIDPGPVLARLPGAPPSALERVDGGLNTPFRDRPGRIDPTDWSLSRKAVALVVLVLLAAASALWLQPARVPLWSAEPAPAAPATQPSEPVAAPSTAVQAPAPSASTGEMPSAMAAPAAADASAATAGAAAAAGAPASVPGGLQPLPAAAPAATPVQAGGGLNIRATEASWLQVSDSQGHVLLSRQLDAGEAVELNGEPPFRLRIGNVRGTEVRYRGAAVDLASAGRANVATLTLP